MSIIKITKLEAAEYQIDKAIELWFDDDNPVSIHTLACSAHQIIHDINRKMGERDLIYDSQIIKDEFRKEINKRLKKDYNYFKHTDKDWNESIDFETDNTIFFILYSCLGLESLGIQHTVNRRIFFYYYIIMHPEIASEKYESEFDEFFGTTQMTEIHKIQKIDVYNYLRKRFSE